MLQTITLMRDLGYKNISEKGICAGLTQMWVQAWLSGPEEEIKFFNRLHRIINVNKSNEDLIRDINLVRKKIKSGFPVDKLTENEYDLLEIVAFFDGIQLYQKPSKYSEFLLQKNLSQVQGELISVVAASDAINSLGNITKIFSEPGVYDETGLAAYFDTLRPIIADEYDKLAISISSGQHRFGLRYDKPSNQWVMVEQTILGDKIEHLYFSLDELIPFIKGVFATENNVVFNIDIFSTNNKLPSDSLIEKLNRFKEQHLRDFNESKAKLETSYTKMTLAHIAAAYGHIDYLQKYIQLKLPLDKPIAEGFTPAHFAAIANQLQAMNILLQAGIRLDAVANNKATPAYLAAEEGFTAILRKIIDSGANILLPGPDNKSLLDIALENNRNDVILSILTAISAVYLTKTQITTLHKHRKKLLQECILFAKNLTADEQLKYIEDIRDSKNALGFLFNQHKPTNNPFKLFQRQLGSQSTEIKELMKVFDPIISTPKLY